MDYFNYLEDQHPNPICDDLRVEKLQYQYFSEIAEPKQQNSFCMALERSNTNPNHFKDTFQIKPLKFVPETESFSSGSTPRANDKHISQYGIIDAPSFHQDQQPVQAQEELNIEALLSDQYSEQRDQQELVQSIPKSQPEPSIEIEESKNYEKKSKQKHAKKATEAIKKIVRLFRKWVKESDAYYSKQIDLYFTCTRFTFSQEKFDANLGIFQELTCCSKDKSTSAENYDDIQLFYIVFNKSPSKGNLTKFFQNSIIRDLWWGNQETTQGQSFFKSKILDENLTSLDLDMLMKVNNFFQGVQTENGKKILPLDH